MTIRIWLAVLGGMGLVACGDDTTTFPDAPAGSIDAPAGDAPSPDGGGTPDGMEPDASTPDGGPQPDGNSTPDAPPAGAWGDAVLAEETAPNIGVPPVVAMDGAGRAIAVWRGEPQIYANTYGFGGAGWGTAMALSNSVSELPSTHPDVAINDAGDAIVVWYQYDATDNNELWARRYSAASGWAAAIQLTDGPTASGTPEVAIGADGAAVVIYGRRNGLDTELWARRATAAGWADPVRLPHTPGTDARPGDVGIDAAGRAVATWSVETEGSIWAARLDPASGWSTPVRVDSAASNDAAPPQLAVAASGDAVIVWQSYAGESPSIWTAVGHAGGTWDAATRLSDASQYASVTDLAGDPSGRALVVWHGWPAGAEAHPSIYASRYAPGAGWSAVETVESSALDASTPSVAMDASGAATVVWDQHESTIGRYIWANRFVPGAGWGTPRKIDAPPGGGYSLEPAAAAGGGRAIAVWPRRIDTHDGPPAHADLWGNVFR